MPSHVSVEDNILSLEGMQGLALWRTSKYFRMKILTVFCCLPTFSALWDQLFYFQMLNYRNLWFFTKVSDQQPERNNCQTSFCKVGSKNVFVAFLSHTGSRKNDCMVWLLVRHKVQNRLGNQIRNCDCLSPSIVYLLLIIFYPQLIQK